MWNCIIFLLKHSNLKVFFVFVHLQKKKIIFDFDSQFQVTRSIYGNNRNSKNVWQVYDEYECMAFLKKNNGTMYECQTHFTNILLKQLVSE